MNWEFGCKLTWWLFLWISLAIKKRLEYIGENYLSLKHLTSILHIKTWSLWNETVLSKPLENMCLPINFCATVRTCFQVFHLSSVGTVCVGTYICLDHSRKCCILVVKSQSRCDLKSFQCNISKIHPFSIKGHCSLPYCEVAI